MDAGDVIVRLVADTKQFQASMTKAEATMKGFSDSSSTRLTNLANKVSTGIVAAGLGAAAVSIKMATDFQSAMTTLVTGAGEAESNIKMVSAGILQLAGVVGQTLSLIHI